MKHKVEICDLLMVVDSSLTVFTDYRIILQGYKHKKQITIVNMVQTRVDIYAYLKADTICGDIPRLPIH